MALREHLYILLLVIVFTIIVGTRSATAEALNSSTLAGILSNTISNTVVVNYITSNEYASNYLISNPSTLVVLLNNTNATTQVLSNPIVAADVDSNGVALVNFLNNPSFPIILANYTGFNSFIGNSSLSGITGNPLVVDGLLANPALYSVYANASALSSFASNSTLNSIESDSGAYASLLSNPSLPSILSNNTALFNFLNDPKSTVFKSNPAALANLFVNPALLRIIGSGQFSSFVANPGASTLLSSPEFVAFVANPAFSSFILKNSTSMSSVLANASSLKGLFSNPALSAITDNSVYTASMLSNPSLGCITANQGSIAAMLSGSGVTNHVLNNELIFSNLLQNPSLCSISKNAININNFLNDKSVSMIVNDNASLATLFTNPNLDAVVANPAGLGIIISNLTAQSLFSNASIWDTFLTGPNLYQAELDAPVFNQEISTGQMPAALSNTTVFSNFYNQNSTSFSSMLTDSPQFISFLNNGSLSQLTGNPTALGGLLSNPSMLNVVSNSNTVSSFLSTKSVNSIFESNGIYAINNFTMYSALLSNPSYTSIVSNLPQLSKLLNNPQMANVVGNSTYLEVLLGNPSLPGIMSNPTQIGSLLNNNQLAGITSNPNELSAILGNPSLPGIMSNPSQLISFMSNNQLSNLVGNNNDFAALLSNPSAATVISNPTQLISLLNQKLSTGQQVGVDTSTAAFTTLLSNPDLPGVMSNPSAFVSLLNNNQLSGIVDNNQEFTALLSSTSLSSIMSNPTQLTSLISNNQFSGILSNQQEFSSLLSSSSLSTIMSDPTQLTSILNNQQLYGITGDVPLFSSILSGSSISTAISSPSTIINFLGSTSPLSSITSDPALLGSLASNPSFVTIINNPTQLSTLLTAPQLSGSLQNVTSLEGVLGSQSLSTMMSDMPAFTSLINNQELAGIVADPKELSALISSHSLSAIIQNPNLMINMINNYPQINQILSDENLASSFLSNQGLASMLSNPQSLTQLSSLIGNTRITNFLSSQAFSGLLSSQSLSGILANPTEITQLASLVKIPGISTALSYASSFGSLSSSLGNITSFSSLLSSQSLGSLLNNPSIASIVNNPIAGSIFNNGALGGILNSPLSSSFFGNSGLGSLFNSGGLGTVFSSGGTTGITSFLGSSGAAGVLGNSQISGVLGASSGLSALGGGVIPGLGPCYINTPYLGFCYYKSTDTVITQYSGFAGNGKITSVPTVAPQSTTPLIGQVLQDNQQYGQQLITCPMPPDPHNSKLYFTSNDKSFIAGNRCLANLAPLVTPITLYTTVGWTPVTLAFATHHYSIGNMANGQIIGIAYSGESGIQGLSQFNLSNGYNTQSYIFGAVPSSSQHELWTWSAKYANLGNVDLSKLGMTQTFSNLEYVIPLVCIYTYDYTVNSAITAVNNANIPVPQYNTNTQNNNWISYSNYVFSSSNSDDKGAGSSCFWSLLNGNDCGSWTKIGENGSVSVSGTQYTDLNVYYGSSTLSSNPNADYQQTLLVAYSGGLVEANAMAFGYTNLNAVPFFTDKITMQSSYTPLNGKPTYYNQSLNVYSTHNYLDPANSLDEFSIGSGSNLWATYNGFLDIYPISSVSVSNPDPNALAMGEGNFVSILFPQQAQQAGFGLSGGSRTLGGFVYGPIKPSYIAAAPNGYVYVIGLDHSCFGSCHISSKTTAYLYTFKYIPQGNYNLTNNQPQYLNTGGISSASAWNSMWKNYYASTFLEGMSNLYMLGVEKISSVTNIPLGIHIDNGGVFYRLVPIAVQSDANGNLFIVGVHKSFGNSVRNLVTKIFGVNNKINDLINTNSGFELAGLLPPGGTKYIENDQVNQPLGFIPSYEMAVSPGGEFVYLANASYGGEIEVYRSVPPSGATSGTNSGAFAYVGNIPLSYSNDTYNLNIIAYLAHGGPYNDPKVAAAYNALYNSGATANDINNWHAPVSIVDSKGILYVLDNWSFEAGSSQVAEKSSILMLRAFSENGTEIPINPTLVDNFNSISGGAVSLPNGNVPIFGWKPYGWPLSATISLPPSAGGGAISYCATDCTNGPNSNVIKNGYAPIGPRIDPEGHVGVGTNSLMLSSDFNGTLYMIAHSWLFNTQPTITYVKQNHGFWSQAWGGITGYIFSDGSVAEAAVGSAVTITTVNPSSKPKKYLYSELLVLHPNIENYTTLSYMANSSDYLCYLSVDPGPNNPCIFNSNTEMLQYMDPPVLGVPDTFGYVENLGVPEQYLNVQNLLSSEFPTGIGNNNYNNKVSGELSNGLPGSSSGNINQHGGVAQSTGNAPKSYINSGISGYIMTPYEITLQLQQNWVETSQIPLNPLISVCPPIVGSVSTSQTHFVNGVTQLASTPPLNITIEGGDSYLKNLPFQTYYQQNLSDAGLILSPYMNYQIFTNRLFGEVYANQTISPATAANPASSRTSLPVVINASHSYNYQINKFEQTSSFGTFPAFDVETAIPSVAFGVQKCGGTCPPKYYYNIGKSANPTAPFNYTMQNISQIFELFELFKRTYMQGSESFDFNNKNTYLGYNRFIYTYIDRFNNTIYMPVDADIANITQLTMNDSIVINPQNANQTSVTVQGNVHYLTPTGTHAVPQGSPVYLYWNLNLNYYNTTSSPSQNPVGYYTNSLLCAIAPTTKDCVLANPLSTETQQQPTGALEANNKAYHPDYNAAGSCMKEPSSLLAPIHYDCNIYGAYNLKAARQDPYNPSEYQYCVPFFPNGTGQFTTQTGLIEIAKTDSNGNFKDTFNACGVGQNLVYAQYYGNPGPEPLIVQQTPLSASAGINEFAAPSSANSIKILEYNYINSPNMTSTVFEIGTYALSIGTISMIELVAVIAGVIVILFGIRRNARKHKKKAR